MNPNPIDDPKLTAYALGELGPRERAEVERRLEADAPARRHVEETLAFAVQIGSALRAEEAPELRSAQLGEIREAARKKEQVLPFPAWLSRMAVPLAAAAGVVVAASLALPAFRHGAGAPHEEVADAAGTIAVRGEPKADARFTQAPEAPDARDSFALQMAKPDGSQMAIAPAAGPNAAGEAAAPIAGSQVAAGEPIVAGKEVAGILADTGGKRGADGLAAGQAQNLMGRSNVDSKDFNVNQMKLADNKAVREEDKSSTRLGFKQKSASEAGRTGGSSYRGALTLGVDMQSAGGGALNSEAAQPASPKGGGAVPKTSAGTTAASGGAMPKGSATFGAIGGGTLGRRSGELAMAEGGGAVAQSAPSAMAGGRMFAYDGGTKNKEREVMFRIEEAPVPACPVPALRAPGQPAQPFDTETYDKIEDNPFLNAKQNPLSTFSIDVDTGSYANVRRFLRGGQLPPAGAVRIEELLNYFEYDYPPAPEGKPFSVTVDVTEAPWNAKHRLARIGLKGREIDAAARPPCNLVFLLDVSGSMAQPNKLPLVKQAMKVLLEQLGEKDRVAIVTYAGASGLALPSTPADRKRDIRQAIDELRPGGSTNGAAGIQLAYDIAKANFIAGGANRVILATDGDFNVGVTSRDELLRLIEEKAKSGVFLTVLGFGMDNLKDATLEQLADKGNGTYGYIDDEREAERLFARHATGSLVTIAKDVKIQIEFNPDQVGAYRLIGYENRALRAEDFNDDKKDAGEIGSGHTVTALYELTPPGEDPALPKVDDLKYQQAPKPAAGAKSDELMTVKLRYKKPDGDTSDKIEVPVPRQRLDQFGFIAQAPADLKFAAAVAEFGMLLRNSTHKGSADWESALELAAAGRGADAHGDRAEFIDLIRAAEKLSDQR